MKLKVNVCLMFLFVAGLSVQAAVPKPDERALWKVWCTGTNSAFVASDVLDACKEFKSKSSKDSFSVVISGFEGWNYLKAGNIVAAAKIFKSMLVEGSATDIQNAGDKMARSWLTRIDREKVAVALKTIYKRDIEFPASLDALKSLKKTAVPPLSDSWGKAWDYRLESRIKGMAAHRYVLESSVLGGRSNLKKSLEVPYADGIKMKPLRILKKVKNMVEFRNSSGKSVVRKLGDSSGRINLVYIGSNIIVLSDGNHWSVMPKPR
ncbi:MAG: hypothetical protein PF904_11485 [Kiritimatiellae bacterium]|jgi:hypothetical protein|nr:hypothetical protein [Kiritimatiellia bacterium]